MVSGCDRCLSILAVTRVLMYGVEAFATFAVVILVMVVFGVLVFVM